MAVFVYQFLFLLLFYNEVMGFAGSPWHYECNNGLCQKEKVNKSITVPKSLETCQLTCGQFGLLWPRPTGLVSLGNNTVFVNYKNITVEGIDSETVVGNYIEQFVIKMQSRVKKLIRGPYQVITGHGIVINFYLKNRRIVDYTLDLDESYILTIRQLQDKTVHVNITANNYYGARNGLETMNQLIVYDEFINDIQMLANATIEDSPVYAYRGILLDTARNFIDKNTIFRTIEAMGMSKLNTLHLHLTDSQSFPYFSKSLPLMSYYGAYSPDKVYMPKDVQDIIEHGYLHGVRIIPELNTPAHVGEGWQWIEKDFVVCFNAKPRFEFCPTPPCGQLNPIHEKTFTILADLYKNLLMDFDPVLFHMGGNNVNVRCWNSSEQIQHWMLQQNMELNAENFLKLWAIYQSKAYDTLIEANDDNKIPVILWDSMLVDPKYMNTIDPEKYIIQITAKSNMKSVGRIIRNNFKVILSNYDSLYLDCGFSSWVDEGNNWCSPYKSWHQIYNYSPKGILRIHKLSEEFNKLILGGEAILWSVQADSSAVDLKLWPRSAALAERLWSDPETTWREAEPRFLRHRERLTRIGVLADTQAPEWCLRNQGHCE